MIELKNCPFCGGRAFIERESICVYKVCCDDCMACGAPVEEMEYEWNEDKAHKDATKVWNQRADKEKP